MRKELDCVHDFESSCGGADVLHAAVMFKFRTGVKTDITMVTPCASLFWLGVHDSLGAGRSNVRFIKVEIAI